MQVAATDLLATALEAIIQAIVLATLLAGGVIWTLKRGKSIDPRDGQIKRLENDLAEVRDDMRRLLDVVTKQGLQVANIEGQLGRLKQRRDA